MTERIKFLAVFGAIILAALVSASFFSSAYNAQCLAGEPIRLAAGQTLDITGIREPDAVLLKLRMIDNIQTPSIGIFGNHVVERMNSHTVEAAVGNQSSFFNYGVPHASLEELTDYLAYVIQKQKLPKLVLVGITNPNHGNGAHELGHQWRMYSGVYAATPLAAETVSGFLAKFDRWFLNNIDFQAILYAVSNVLNNKCGNAGAAETGQAGWINYLPRSIAALLRGRQSDVPERKIAWNADGSISDSFKSPMVPMPIESAQKSVLRAGDEYRIADIIMTQSKMVEQAGGRAVFFVVPRFEADEPTQASRILEKALALASAKATIIKIGISQKDYYDPAHPGDAYFESLLREAIPVLSPRK